MEKEKWKDIKNYEGLYKVSSFGNVFTLPRRLKTKNWSKKVNRVFTHGRNLKLIKQKIGYKQVTLSKDKKSTIFLVHRLVATAFIENEHGKPQVNHLDGNKGNNNINNLEWCTASENGKHSYSELGNVAWHKGKSGRNTPTSKPVIQKSMDGKIVKVWECGLDAVRQGGFQSSSISRCANGKQNTHRGYLWEYEK